MSWLRIQTLEEATLLADAGLLWFGTSKRKYLWNPKICMPQEMAVSTGLYIRLESDDDDESN